MESRGQLNFSSIDIGNLDIRDDILEQEIASNVPVAHTDNVSTHNEYQNIQTGQDGRCIVCSNIHKDGEACDSATHILTSCYDRWNKTVAEIG